MTLFRLYAILSSVGRAKSPNNQKDKNMKAKEYLVLVARTISTHGHRDNKYFQDAAQDANFYSSRNSDEAVVIANRVKATIKDGLAVYVPGALYFDPIVAVEYATLTAHDDFAVPTGKPIVKGSIVKARCGWYRVSAVIGQTVNLAGVFGGKIWFKRVPLAECVEDEAAWYKNWQQSETYRSM